MVSFTELEFSIKENSIADDESEDDGLLDMDTSVNEYDKDWIDTSINISTDLDEVRLIDYSNILSRT